jgi:hypothetical protein
MGNNMNTKTKNKNIFVLTEAERLAAKAVYEKSSLWDKKTKKNTDFTQKFFTLKDINALEKLMDMIYPKSRYTPTAIKQTDDDLIDLGTIIKYFPRDLPESKKMLMLAYVAHTSHNIFKIFINEDCEDESFGSMDLHEKGHVLFNHTQNPRLYIDEFREELEKVWDTRLAKYFEAEVKRNPKNKEKIVNMLFREFSNIAQDMEINSKLFDNGEWVKAKKTMARSGIIVHLKAVKRELDTLSGLFKNPKIDNPQSPEYLKILKNFEFVRFNLLSRIEGEEGDFQFCYPENKGWPNKLDWMTYMILLVKDLDETMQQVIKNIKAALGGGQGQGQGGGQGGQQGQGGGQPISQDVLDNYDSNAQDEADAQSSDGSGDKDGEGDSDDDIHEIEPPGRSKGGQGRGRGHGGQEIEFEMVSSFEEFTKFLRRTCIGKKNRKWNSDVLYNSNRGKFSGHVVVPRRHLVEKWMPQSACFVIDISGSVNSDLVENAINSIIDTASGIDLKSSHIIFCDTRVTADEIMSKRTKKIYSGGGTEIANGIKYVHEKGYCKKATDFLFIISDLQDHLVSWVNEADKIHCNCFVVGYGYSNKEDAGRVVQYAGGDREFAERWNRKFKTIFINS